MFMIIYPHTWRIEYSSKFETLKIEDFDIGENNWSFEFMVDHNFPYFLSKIVFLFSILINVFYKASPFSIK